MEKNINAIYNEAMKALEAYRDIIEEHEVKVPSSLLEILASNLREKCGELDYRVNRDYSSGKGCS